MQLSGGNLSYLYFIVLFKKSVWRNSLLKAEGMQHSDRTMMRKVRFPDSEVLQQH